MKTIKTWTCLWLCLCCGAIAQDAKTEFTDEEIQGNINAEAHSRVDSSPIIDYCWRSKKINFLKQYMVSKHFTYRADMLRKIQMAERNGDAENDIAIPLLLHALKTDGIWKRPPIGRPSEVNHLGYELNFISIAQKKFPDIKLNDVNNPLERQYAIKYIEGTLDAEIQQNNKNNPPRDKTLRRVENDVDIPPPSPNKRTDASHQDAEIVKDKPPVTQWLYAVLVTVLTGVAIWYLRRNQG